MNLLALWAELDQDPEAFWRMTPRLMMTVIKGRTVGADRPPAPLQSIEEQIAISMRWAAVSPPMSDLDEVPTNGE